MPVRPRVAIVMGSRSDLGVMKPCVEVLRELDISCEVRVISAHRTPDVLFEYVEGAADAGIEVIVAGAGGAAHLPGVIAAKTHLPVLGVPVAATPLGGFDALLSIAQMPGGVPVATMAVGKAGAKNGGLFAGRIIAVSDDAVRGRVIAWMAKQVERIIGPGTLVSDAELEAVD